MMRLLFLCLLLLLPAASVASEDTEASGDDGMDDEDFVKDGFPGVGIPNSRDSSVLDKTTGEEDKSEQLTVIIIIVAVCVLTLSVATIVTVLLVRRHMHSRQQGIYSVPAEQDHKGPV